MPLGWSDQVSSDREIGTAVERFGTDFDAGYAAAVRAGGLVFVAGQVPVDDDGRVVGDAVDAQTRQVFRNLERVLGATGSSMHSVIKLTVYATSREYLGAIREVRHAIFGRSDYPASTFLVVRGLAAPEYLVEIEAVALADAGKNDSGSLARL